MFAVLMIIGCFMLVGLAISLEKKSIGDELLNVVMGSCGILAGIVLILTMGVNHLTSGATVANYDSIKSSIEIARKENVSDVERAALNRQIIEVNKSITFYRYYNETIFDGFIPNELTKLEYLE